MLRYMRDLSVLPKAHLHVHLESTIRWDTLREIGGRNGVTVPDRGGAFGGFSQFAAHNELVRS
jgi:adenosine deaminase